MKLFDNLRFNRILNKTLWHLLFIDLIVGTGFGLIAPIFAIFLKDNLIGGSILSAGIASAIFLITKCSIQLPFSRFVDRQKKKMKWLLIGTIIISIAPIIYIFANNIYWIYLAEFIFGIGSGIEFPVWTSIWTRNLDKRREGFQWSVYSTFVSFGIGLAGLVGAALASIIGFSLTFVIVELFCLVSIGIILNLYLREKKGK